MAEKDDQRDFALWLSEIQHAQKDPAYRKWLDQSERITKRYRDERKSATIDYSKRRYNILWANVQTLGPAVYGKAPKPVVERTFLTRDPVGRLASLILERVITIQMRVGKFHTAAKKARRDYLLPGMGQIWVRYEPTFESAKVQGENDEIEAEEADESPDEEADEGLGTPEDKLTYESLCFDYIFYRDFLWSPSRAWCETPWVARRIWPDKAEAIEQFGQEIADKMVFGDPRQKDLSGVQTTEPIVMGRSKKAECWAIWCKPERMIYYIAPDTPGVVLKRQPDPLKLEGFFPCPEPLFATQTNDTLIPVPDYVEYQDQAMELDDLTDRIDNITSALRVNGVYNSEYPALQRLLQAGQDNKLIAVDDWAAFAEKGGIPGAMSLVPIQDIITVLQSLYEARDHTIQDIYQITGISDVIRGATDPNETFGAQKIKANYATGRLGSRQEDVAEFCANIVRIAAEMIAELFSDESLLQMSGVDQMFEDQVREAVEAVPQPQMPQIPDGAPPQAQQIAQQQVQAQWEQAKQQAAQAKSQELHQQFDAALKILRSDKLRGFRVDIETDSTIADDLQQDKQAVSEFVSSLFSSIQGAEQTLSVAPELVKPMGETILFAARKFRVGRSLESAWEDALDKLEKRVEDMRNQPPKPDPETIKAEAAAQLAQVKGQAVAQKSQSDTQIAQLTAQAENARSKADIQVQTIQLQSEQRQDALKTQIEGLKLQLEASNNKQDNLTASQKAWLDYYGKVRVAEINAGVATDQSTVDAKVELILGLGKIVHEQTQNALDRQHEANTVVAQQQHDRTMQKEAPKPNGAVK